MKLYLVCIKPKGTVLKYGETYLCKINSKGCYSVWNSSNNYYGYYKKMRFVQPTVFEKEYNVEQPNPKQLEIPWKKEAGNAIS